MKGFKLHNTNIKWCTKVAFFNLMKKNRSAGPYDQCLFRESGRSYSRANASFVKDPLNLELSNQNRIKLRKVPSEGAQKMCLCLIIVKKF